jgi:hypothetical protein
MAGMVIVEDWAVFMKARKMMDGVGGGLVSWKGRLWC